MLVDCKIVLSTKFLSFRPFFFCQIFEVFVSSTGSRINNNIAAFAHFTFEVCGVRSKPADFIQRAGFILSVHCTLGSTKGATQRLKIRRDSLDPPAIQSSDSGLYHIVHCTLGSIKGAIQRFDEIRWTP